MNDAGVVRSLERLGDLRRDRQCVFEIDARRDDVPSVRPATNSMTMAEVSAPPAGIVSTP